MSTAATVTMFTRSLGAVVTASLIAFSAHAQTPGSTAPGAANNANEETVVLDPFLVSNEGDTGYFAKNTMSGTRSTERLVNIPQNIQIINSEFLQDVNLDNGVDAFKYGASGINKKEATSGDTYIRGFRVGGNSFLRNGVKFRGNLNIPLYDIDRIEIIKGPAALLFGADAGSGGVINYISKPAATKQEYYVKGTVGSFSLYRAEASSTGPLIQDKLSYRATVAASDSDWRRDFDYFKDAFFSIASNYRLSDRTTLGIYYNYYFVDQIVSTESVDTQGRFLRIGRDFSQQESWVKAPRYTQYGNIVLNTKFTDTLSARFLANGSEQNFDFHQVFNARVPDATVGVMNRTYQNYYGKERQVNFQADFLKTFETGPVSHKVTFGGTEKIQRLRQGFDNAPLAPINVYNPVYGTPRPTIIRNLPAAGGSTSSTVARTREDFAYLQEQATFLKGRIIAVGGISWNGVNTTRQNRIANTLAQQVDRAFVKRYGIVGKPLDWLSVYYNYSESFQFINNIFIGGPRNGELLDPSYTDNNEFGVKAETSNGLLFGSIVAFDMLKTNVVSAFTQPDGTPGTRQEASEKNKGWEADIGIGFNFPVGRSQTILTYYDGNSKNAAGIVPDGVTNKIWSAFSTLDFADTALNGFRIGGGVYHRDDFTMANGTGQLVKFRAPAFTTTTAFVNYRRASYSLSLGVDNLADKKYVEGGDSAGAMNIGLGRTWKFSADYRF